MAQAGILRPDERVELIEGEIFAMTPQGTPHAAFIAFLDKVLQQGFGEQVSIRTQLPLTLSQYSEPEPDLAVVAGSPLDYAQHHPTAALLIVEIADTSLTDDRSRKGPLYAKYNVPEYWIVNIPDRQVEIYRNPSSTGYQTTKMAKAPKTISPLHAPHCTLNLSQLFAALNP